MPEPTQQESTSNNLNRPRGFFVLITACVSLAILWISFPPIGPLFRLFWLAWFAPVPLIWLVINRRLPAKRPYWQLFYAGFLYWLATFYFIPIPHPALWLGWLAVSAYMAIYTPLFVGISRTMVHRFGIPEVVAIPMTWTGLEWFRCNFATGMAMYCLSHTQFKHPQLIQVADLSGAYTLTFAMMVCATGLAMLSLKLVRPKLDTKSNGWPTIVVSSAFAAGIFAAVFFYGQYRLNEQIEFRNENTLTFGLIQTSEDVIFARPTKLQIQTQVENKFSLTWEARRKWDDLDLIVWPESGLNPYSDLLSDYDKDYTVEILTNEITRFWSDATGFPRMFNTPLPLLTGGGTEDPENNERFNAGLLISTDGSITNRYFKNHLVMFGEYVPFARQFPFINSISPIPSLTPGSKFEVMELDGVKIAPSICFETTVPHFVRRQINTLSENGTEPDVMVNLTNDGWFYGTSCLDAHLACNVFRAVEMRKPHLICANTGFSGEIDTCGRMVQVGPRRESTVIRVEVRPIVRESVYRKIGDIVPMIFGIVSLLIGLIGWIFKSK